ncbi:hypothetical protein CBM2623_U20016 [Cupriavidus taiwanensis]|nr:hypothetical protein CBM2608_U30018 [Cupriavidus taiwanensis]SPA38392.1 hypothetical protein CBM2623_U20016 [Cupriavidus taiwanensis]
MYPHGYQSILRAVPAMTLFQCSYSRSFALTCSPDRNCYAKEMNRGDPKILHGVQRVSGNRVTKECQRTRLRCLSRRR